MNVGKPGRTSSIAGALACAAAWLVPLEALACPVCFSAKDEASRVAFLGTTVFLTALPIVLVGAVIYWLAARSAQIAKAEREELAQAVEPEAGTPVDDAPGALITR